MAAKDILFGKKIPQQKGVNYPFFSGLFLQTSGLPQTKYELNVQKLRALSETPIPRRAIRYIKSQVSRLDHGIVAKPGVKLKASQKKQIDVLNAVFKAPNAEGNWTQFIEKVIEDALVLGRFYVVVKEWPENPQHPLLLYPTDAGSFQIYMNWDGSPNKPRYAQFDLHGNRVDFLPDEIWSAPFDARTSDPFGLAPMAVCAQEVEYLLAAMAYAGGVASTAYPKKLLHLGEDADMEAVKETRIYFHDEIEGRATLPIIGGTKAPTTLDLGYTTDESLFLKWQERLIATVANAFGLDVQKMNLIVGINRSTGDQLDDASDEGALLPVIAMLENSINNFFLRRYDLFDVAEFRIQMATSNTDKRAISVINQINLQDDTYTINEARAELGLGPLPDDPETGKSKGDYTLSEYRARYARNNMLNISEQVIGDDQIPDAEKGNNGVHSAAVPKEKAYNQGKELNTEPPKGGE